MPLMKTISFTLPLLEGMKAKFILLDQIVEIPFGVRVSPGGTWIRIPIWRRDQK